MKALALVSLLVLSLTAIPAMASTPVYNSKANSLALSCTSNCALSDSFDDSRSASFDARSSNTKLGSPHAGSISLDVTMTTFRSECTKCSS